MLALLCWCLDVLGSCVSCPVCLCEPFWGGGIGLQPAHDVSCVMQHWLYWRCDSCGHLAQSEPVCACVDHPGQCLGAHVISSSANCGPFPVFILTCCKLLYGPVAAMLTHPDSSQLCTATAHSSPAPRCVVVSFRCLLIDVFVQLGALHGELNAGQDGPVCF
jgi:hypothetical protein